MGLEIERKFLVEARAKFPRAVRQDTLVQGYLPDTGSWEIRLRKAGDQAFLTMKQGKGLSRTEWEKPLSDPEFQDLWPQTAGRRLEKVRTVYEVRGVRMEVDRYSEVLEGLRVVEIEFPDGTAARAFSPPKDFGAEITFDPRFKNRQLAETTGSVPGRELSTEPLTWAYGVLPFIQEASERKLVVVSSRRHDRWLFPKGQPESRMSPQALARLEAKEEAGIDGRIVGHPILLPYARESLTTNLLLFPMRVTRIHEKWLEMDQRQRRLVGLAEAIQGELGELVKWGAQWLQDLGP